MIVAAGLTPAWQHILAFEKLGMGEVNRALDVHWCASGKVLNVAVALHHLAAEPLALSVLGGFTGELIERELGAMGMRRRWVWTEGPTRICTTLLERTTGIATELVENGPAIGKAALDDYVRVFAQVAAETRVAVLSGSLSSGAPKSLYSDLLMRTRARVILDARGPELLDALARRPFIVKPNREELARTLGRELPTDRHLREALEEVHRLGAEWAIVSQGKKTVWVCGQGEIHGFRPPDVATVNPIGCGDCMAAALAWALDRGADVPTAVRLGMGAAAQNASTLLPGRLDVVTVERLAREVVQEF